MVSVPFPRHTRDVARRDTNALLLTLDRVARSRADSCLRAGISVGNLFRDKSCDAHLGETLVSNVTQGSLIPHTTSSFVWHTNCFVTLFHFHAASTIGRVTPLLEIGVTDVHSSWSKLWLNWFLAAGSTSGRGGNTTGGTSSKSGARFPRKCSNVFNRLSTPFCQWSALHSTHFKSLVVDSNTMTVVLPMLTKPHSLRPLDIQYHVRVVRTVLEPQDSFSKFQTFFMHSFAKQPLVACAAIRALHVLGDDVRHTLHQPSHHRVLTGNVAIELALQNQQMYPQHTLLFARRPKPEWLEGIDLS